MPDEVLVVVEHHGGKLGRSAWEAVAAGQSLAHDTGLPVAAVILGHNVSTLAAELGAAELSEILQVESPLLAEYTADGYAHALRETIQQRQSKFVVFSHTYQVRDLAPKLAASLDRGLISDCLGYRKEGSRFVFIRQIFQGKYCSDVEFVGEPPFLVTFQAAAFREDAVHRTAAAARVTPIVAPLTSEQIRTRPGERFREARQAVDLSQAEVIVAVGRGIKAPEHLELAKRLAEVLGGELGASRPICDNGWLPIYRQIG